VNELVEFGFESSGNDVRADRGYGRALNADYHGQKGTDALTSAERIRVRAGPNAGEIDSGRKGVPAVRRCARRAPRSLRGDSKLPDYLLSCAPLGREGSPMPKERQSGDALTHKEKVSCKRQLAAI
jgi:hypothetical protein